MPLFMGRIIVYQRELEEEEDQVQIEEEAKNQNEEGEVQKSGEPNQINQNKKSETFKNELIEGLKVNIYLQKNNEITQISNSSWEDILNEKNPHRRRMKTIIQL